MATIAACRFHFPPLAVSLSLSLSLLPIAWQPSKKGQLSLQSLHSAALAFLLTLTFSLFPPISLSLPSFPLSPSHLQSGRYIYRETWGFTSTETIKAY